MFFGDWGDDALSLCDKCKHKDDCWFHRLNPDIFVDDCEDFEKA